MFLSTTGLHDGEISRWLDKSEFGILPSIETEKQRTRIPSNRSEQESKRAFLNEFLDSLPKLPSHYGRQNSEKLYLETIITSKQQSFEMYVEECAKNEVKSLSIFTFTEMFNDKNISILKLEKDKCDLCHSHEIGLTSDEEWQIHRTNVDRAREELKRDNDNAELNECIVFSMDLKAVKVCPFVQASAIFYKTKLCCHNFTVYNNKTHETVCYWFDETAADMSASTFATCVIKFLETKIINKNLPIIFYSDGCTYQNRNAILSNALLQFSMEHNVEIYQKYLVVGHTQMPCDSVHATIESYCKKRDVYLPHDYIRFTREARKHPFPYEVEELNFNDIRDYKLCQRYSTIRPGNKKNDPKMTYSRH